MSALLDRLRAAEKKATPLPHEVAFYDHGGGRVFSGHDLIADFYQQEDRDFWIDLRQNAPLLLAALELAEAVEAFDRCTCNPDLTDPACPVGPYAELSAREDSALAAFRAAQGGER